MPTLLYNGNIGNSTYAIDKINSGATMGYSYNYDQLNRIKNMWQHDVGPGNWGYGNKTDAYNESFSYDGNGNILTLNRKKAAGAAMDQLTYGYTYVNGKLKDNRLNAVTDATNSGEAGELAGTSNYGYDQIGNLLTDNKAGIIAIDWNNNGKIRHINQASGNISYTYDPTGNRVSKTYNGLTTYYLRDAQGNSLAVYDNSGGTSNWREQHLYGSNRLGMWKPNINLATTSGSALWPYAGLKFFELSNHLGNVNVVINDIRTYASGAYDPTIINSNDYYAFGGQMNNRTFTNPGSTSYRYGFNGQEKSKDIDNTGNSYNAEFWQYEARIGRRWNLDPKPVIGISEYATFENNPIFNFDVLGDTIRKRSNWDAANHFKFASFYFNALQGETDDPKNKLGRNCSMCCLNAIASNLTVLYGTKFKVGKDYDEMMDQVGKLGYRGDREVAVPTARGVEVKSGFDFRHDRDFNTGIVDNMMAQMKGNEGKYVFGVGIAMNYHSTIVTAYNNGEELTDPRTFLKRKATKDNPLFYFVEDAGGARLMDAKQLEAKMNEFVTGAGMYYSGESAFGKPEKTSQKAPLRSNIDNLEFQKK